ncbi:amino acid adenylation domain-containing protein, partial [Clostridium puniceum]|uniref:amino acid adenylation domain-containing protein n=1 Tax=Clostridium puniceum TaxID=29367 RepID=UPI001177BBD6
SISISFSKEETERLLRKTSAAYNTQINDILLCSLGLAVKEWSRNDKVLISLEGHGREEILKDVSIDRTIGWFTSMYPVILDMTYNEDISYSIQYTKETLRHIPNNGVGYGILKYLTNNQNNKDISFKLKPEISFNYLGEFVYKESKDSFRYSELTGGMAVSTANKKLNSIEINGLVSEGKLELFLNYSTKEYEEETVANLLEGYKRNLIKVVEHCESKKETQKTPWDYGDNELSIEDLNKILSSEKDIEKIHSLAPMQEGMLYNLILDKKSHAYFEQSVFTLEGTLRVEILNKVFNTLIEKYEVLRTAFFYGDISKPKQAVLSKREMLINYEDITTLEDSKQEEYIENFKRQDRDKGFDLNNDCLIRISVIKTKDNRYKLIYSFHHIIMDGWCIGIIMNDIVNMYKALCEEKEITIGRTESYSNYLEWLDKQDKVETLEYWKNYLEGYEQEAVIPKMNKKSQNFNPEEEEIILDDALTGKLKSMAEKNSITMNAVIQTAWGILLQKYNNTDDVVFGSVISGRPSEITDIENMVGLFINTVPIRVTNREDIQFRELAQKLNKDFIEANMYGYCSLAEVQALTDMKNKLINHVTVYENYPINEEMMNSHKNKKSELSIIGVESFEQTNYDLELVIIPGNQLNIKLTYNSSVYDKKVIGEMLIKVYNILNFISNKPECRLTEIDIITREEQEKLLYEFNNTKTTYPKEKTIQELFEEQVEKSPNNIAVTFNGKELTYKELNEKSNSLARLLREKGVSSEKIVGIMVERSLDMIVGIMGILKAGGAYLPIDPEYPEERISYMLEDSSAQILLTKKSLLKDINFEGEIIDLENQENYAASKENIEKINTSRDLAYIIYTSGSTGKPKGTKIMHYSVTRVVKNTNYISIDQEDIILQLSSYAFDGSVFDIYGALLNGAKLAMIDKDSLLNIDKLSYFIQYNKVSIFFITTALFNTLVDNKIECLKNIRKVLFGGERISILHAKKALDYMGKDKIIHVYGPTESTVFSNYYFINSVDENADNVPIGRPLSNSTVYILGKNNELKPIGIPGELCVGGDGVARGYLNNLELTREKFVDNPFELETKMYKTGDLA